MMKMFKKFKKTTMSEKENNRIKRKKNWTSGEEVALAKAWVHISTCPKVGNEQSRYTFSKRLLEHFKENVKDTTRSHHSLNTKWQNMNAAMGVFNGLFIQQGSPLPRLTNNATGSCQLPHPIRTHDTCPISAFLSILT
ncbi:myb-like domain, Myb/SANT-like DNA-binding domain protein [Artemisia annua]|uniref:Myb-like domain, Myb/SANT-like DNA-binding domain protein n=1 Tax=Artemisia annua TaxID=35608 RepID=A0A2U1KDH6_ARTAN|nr:myb-like domain, Myb/SANT-like DNA-binding domain protein [Artemisia annua]